MSVDKRPDDGARIEHLETQVRELAFLHETSQLLTATLDLDSLLRSLMTQVRDFFQVEAVSVALIDEDEEQLTFRVAVGEASEAVTGLKLPLGKGIAGWVAERGESILVRDVYSDPRFFSGVDERTAFRTQTVLAAPIKTEQGPIGAIEALNPSADVVDERHLQVLDRVAEQAALAIHNAELYQRARRAEQRYERLFHGSPVPVFVMDFDTRIIDLNEKAADLIGRPPDELIRTRWCDWLGEAQEACEAFFGDAPKTGKATTQMMVPSQSGPRTLRVHMTAINYGGERAIQWIGHDITELTELERMRDDLMHMIVHDLQNPLSNIVGSLQMMDHALSHGDDAIPMMDVLRVAMRSSKRLQRLINSLLDLRQLEEGKADLDRVMVRPGHLAQEALDVVRPVIHKKGQDLTVDIPPNLPPVAVDQDMIIRVLTNLLDNAAKFTQTGGAIGLYIAQREDSVAFTVSDNGPGIASDALDRVFERFTRLENTRKTKGTGLGLPFCKLAVEAHGGKISVDSTPGEGSEFTITLPLEAG